MAKVWSVYFPKGGVGKTTLTFNMARYYALQGLNVLAIGLDDQASLTQALSKNVLPSSYDDLLLACAFASKNRKELLLETLMDTDLSTLKFIPESKSLRPLYTLIREQYGLSFLRDSLLKLLTNDFDLILFDCPPAQSNSLVQAALVASDLIVVPYSCQAAAVTSWQNNFDELSDFVKKSNKNCKIKAIINNYKNTGNAKEAVDFLQTYYPQLVIGEPILMRNEVDTSFKNHLSLQEISKNSINAERLAAIFKLLWSNHGQKNRAKSVQSRVRED
jgi:chromosome partitioning protein